MTESLQYFCEHSFYCVIVISNLQFSVRMRADCSVTQGNDERIVAVLITEFTIVFFVCFVFVFVFVFEGDTYRFLNVH